jgi:hypothetical protein
MKTEQVEKYFIYLQQNGYLEYGKIIPKHFFELIFGKKFDTSTFTDSCLGEYLTLKEYLEENGYLCTSKNQLPGDLRILDVDEMVIRSNEIMRNLVRRMKKLHSCMAHAKVEHLSYKEHMAHIHTSNKIYTSIYSMSSLLATI